MGDIVHGGILSMGGYCPWGILSIGGILSMGDIVHGGYCLWGDIVHGGYCPWGDIVHGGYCPWGDIVQGGILPIGGIVHGGYCPWGDIVHGGILSMGGYCPWRILSMGGYCPWGDIVHGGYCPWGILSMGGKKVERMVKPFLEDAHVSISEQEQQPRRTTNLPSRFDGFIVTDSIPSENNAKSQVAIFAECLDLIENEFERRFSSENIKLWQAMEALSPNSNNFLDSDVLVPFFEYAQSVPVVSDFFLKNEFSIQDLNAECRIFSRVFKDEQWPKEKSGKIDIVDVANFIRKNHESSAHVLLQLYYVAITAGFTSTRVECLFSSLTRIDSPLKKLKTARECDLAYLTFESGVFMNGVTFDDFLHAWKASPRELLQI